MKNSNLEIINLQIGDKLVLKYFPGNINNRIYHVRGFVDGLVAVRVWSKRKQYYQYSFLSQYELDINRDNIKLVRHKKRS